MRNLLVFFGLALVGALAAQPAHADGKGKVAPSFTRAPPLNTQGPVQQADATPLETCAPCANAAPPVIEQSAEADGLRLDAVTIGTMTGGVGVGVEQAFVGGGFFGGGGAGAVSSNGAAFGTRASGFFAQRNVAFASRLSAHRPISGKRR